MVYDTFGLGYDELKTVLQEVNRRRRLFQFRGTDCIHKKLLEACLVFAKNGLRIVNKVVIRRLCVAFRELRIAKRHFSIFLEGEMKTLEMQVQYRARGVFKWAPKLETWLQIESYKFWLGTIQHSLTNESCPAFEMVDRHSGAQ